VRLVFVKVTMMPPWLPPLAACLLRTVSWEFVQSSPDVWAGADDDACDGGADVVGALLDVDVDVDGRAAVVVLVVGAVDEAVIEVADVGELVLPLELQAASIAAVVTAPVPTAMRRRMPGMVVRCSASCIPCLLKITRRGRHYAWVRGTCARE
jgi:hypothetical protein